MAVVSRSLLNYSESAARNNRGVSTVRLTDIIKQHFPKQIQKMKTSRSASRPHEKLYFESKSDLAKIHSISKYNFFQNSHLKVNQKYLKYVTIMSKTCPGKVKTKSNTDQHAVLKPSQADPNMIPK